MFWGLVLEPSKSYAQLVDTPFHVSMAALDLKNSDNQEEASTLILRQDNTEYVLANLSKKHKIFNTTLGLDFDVGEEIEFFVQGQSQIHLTGFLAGGDEDDDLDDLTEEEEKEVQDRLKEIKQAEAVKRKMRENPSGPTKKQKILDESFNDDSEEDDFDFDEDDLEDGDEEESDDSEMDDDEEEDSDVEGDVPSPPKKEVKTQQQKQAGAQSPESKKQKKKQKQQQGKQVNQQQKNQANKNQSPQKNQQLNKTPQKTPQGKNLQGKTPNNQAKTPTNGNKQQNAKSPQGNTDAQQKKVPTKRVLKGGLVVEDIAEGSGKVASSNKSVGVYYVGRLSSNKKEFDKSMGGKPFSFRLGRGEVIRGWDLGVEGMREGGKRKLTIPAKFAYGNSGAPPLIPPNSTLEFEVTLVNVK